MDYKEEDQEDKRYRKESKFGRKEFKKASKMQSSHW